jgi:1-acyl-sn-glycerol-3-phosphate acyltransferase
VHFFKAKDYFYDRPASGPGHFGQIFCHWFFGVCRLAFSVFRFRSWGLNKVSDFLAEQAAKPKSERRGLIIAGNHESYLDPLFVIRALRPGGVRFMVKDDFMDYFLAGRGVAWAGGFPIKRDSADMRAVKRAMAMLKRGEIVGIFPEGTRVSKHPDDPDAAKPADGIALIAQLGHADVMPFRLWGNAQIMPKDAHFLHFPKVSLRFGDSLSLTEAKYREIKNKQERFSTFTDDVMAAIYGMPEPAR